MKNQNSNVVTEQTVVDLTPMSIAFDKKSTADTVRQTVAFVCDGEPNPFDALVAIMPFGEKEADRAKNQHRFEGRDAKGIAAIKRIAAIIADFNTKNKADGNGTQIKHGVTKAWFSPVSDEVKVEQDGTVYVTFGSVKDGYFPHTRKSLYSDNGEFLGKAYTVPAASLLTVVIDGTGKLFVEERPYRCAPTNPSGNMAEGQEWRPVTKNGAEVVNYYDDLHHLASRVFRPAKSFLDPECDYARSVVDYLDRYWNNLQDLKAKKSPVGDTVSGSNLAALEAAAKALQEANAGA